MLTNEKPKSPNDIIHEAVNRCLQQTGDLAGTLGALSVALHTVEVLFAMQVQKSQQVVEAAAAVKQ